MSNTPKTGTEFIDYMLNFDSIFIIHLALYVILISAFIITLFIYRINDMLHRKREAKKARLFNLALNKDRKKSEEP